MRNRHTILVVDDEPDVVQSVTDLLRLDYKVLGATRAQDAVRLMEEQEVDVIMSDQRMPEMTGVQLLNRIRGPHPEATRLLFTGYADIRAVVDAINQGNVYRYITKPWDPDELQTIIREACERHDLIVERREMTDALHRKNVELEQANAQLSRADELKTAFIQVASHELRTPLTILNGYAQLAAAVADVPAPLREWLSRIRQASTRLQNLVNQILAMLETGDFQARLRLAPADLGELVTSVVDDIRPFIDLRHQSFVRDWPDDLGTMNIDAEKIRESLNHLLLNAIKFTPDGGRITLRGRRTDEGGAEFTVIDTGCGMDQAALEHFGKTFFTQFDVTHHASGTFEHGRRGLGLGVSVVKKLIEMHGGSLSVTSEPGKGTAVTFRLPPSADAPNQQKEHTAAATA